MKTEAYKEWISLYTDEVGEIWNNGKYILRKATMILFVLQREFKRVQDDLEKQHSQVIIDVEQKLLHTSPKTTSKNEDQRNPIYNETLLKSATPKNTQEKSPIKNENELRISNESSDDTVCCSPKISRQKYFKRKKPKCSPENIFVKKVPLCEDKYSLPVQKINSISNLSGSNTSSSSPKLSSQCKDNLIDCTVIDSTPTITKNAKKGRTLMDCGQKKNKLRKNGNGVTLTQMFFTNSTSSTKENKKCNAASSSSENTNTVMLENNRNIVDNMFHEETDFKQPKEVICKEPVVRGNKRQQLDGWDCEECSNFYEGLDIDTQQVKSLLNKCSKHRATRRPNDYTPPGYWTLAFSPTQKTMRAETERQNLLDDSTFFQF